jgi:hypothetical protein
MNMGTLRRNLNHSPTTRRGSVTLEWVLLATVVIIGTIGGVAAVRNALILEYREMTDVISDMSVVDDTP